MISIFIYRATVVPPVKAVLLDITEIATNFPQANRALAIVALAAKLKHLTAI